MFSLALEFSRVGTLACVVVWLCDACHACARVFERRPHTPLTFEAWICLWAGDMAATLYACLPLSFVEEADGRWHPLLVTTVLGLYGAVAAVKVLTHGVPDNGDLQEYATYQQAKLKFATYSNFPATVECVACNVGVGSWALRCHGCE